MRSSSRMPWLLALLALLASLALLAGCSSSASTARGHGTTPTATGAHGAPSSSTSPPASAPPHAFAWTQFDGSGTPQIWASINGAAPAQITHALPSPSVITASVTSPGRAGDPSFHSYTPDALDFPVWKWDSTQFWAATKPDSESSSPGTKALYNYRVGAASGSVSVSGGYNPWYTIGG